MFVQVFFFMLNYSLINCSGRGTGRRPEDSRKGVDFVIPRSRYLHRASLSLSLDGRRLPPPSLLRGTGPPRPTHRAPWGRRRAGTGPALPLLPRLPARAGVAPEPSAVTEPLLRGRPPARRPSVLSSGGESPRTVSAPPPRLRQATAPADPTRGAPVGEAPPSPPLVLSRGPREALRKEGSGTLPCIPRAACSPSPNPG